MLVLSRKTGESVIIGDGVIDGGVTIDGNIKIKVIEVRRGVVRLGIEAPKNVPVFRDEIFVSNPRAAAG